ncbi:MAG: HEPN domain-containing protein [Candidatus Manganitrophus sp. SB1]|nr:HEPN domain-containing protein [Candidatus Manganitrophus morganii]
MKPETLEWVEKAEGDLKVARREMGAVDPVWNVICFLAQQCGEKYLKAFLEESNIAFPKTHDLVVLLNISGEPLQDLKAHKEQLARLSVFGIASRYPGRQADREAAEDSMKTAEMIRTILRSRFGLP